MILLLLQGESMNHHGNNIEARLWAAADELRANSKLKSSEYSVPVLGLVFLRYADHKFSQAEGAGGQGWRSTQQARRNTIRRKACSICRRRRVFGT